MTFAPGNKSGGRPKGARNRLSHKFLLDLTAEWEEHGPKTLRIMRMEKPVEFVKCVAAILPRELLLDHSSTAIADLDDDDLDTMIEAIRQRVIEQRQPLLIESKSNGKEATKR